MIEKKINIINRLRAVNCTGCTACYNVCPAGAISMKEDGEGFSYPDIEEDKCTGCGLCEKKCPVLSKDSLPKNRKTPDIYAAWHKDLKIRMLSSSGGVFTALSSAVFNKGGHVYGAAFDEQFFVYHKSACNSKELGALRQSKYLQSNIGNSFVQAKGDLENGCIVLFTGTPCQIAGLYAYLGRNDDNLFTCSVICKGVPSPKVFRRYLDSLEKGAATKVASYSFRDKHHGWGLNESVIFSNGKERHSSHSTQEVPYYYAFAEKSLFIRSSCYACPFKGLPSVSDITLADFWSIRIKDPEWDDNRGTSLVLVNSDKGSSIFKDAKEYLLTQLCPLDYIKDNYNLFFTSRRPPERERFFKDLGKLPFEAIVKKYMTPPHPAIQTMKNIFRKAKSYIRNMIGR